MFQDLLPGILSILGILRTFWAGVVCESKFTACSKLVLLVSDVKLRKGNRYSWHGSAYVLAKLGKIILI